MALDPGRGRSAVPGRSAIAAAALGITGVVAALVVGASLGRLETEPGRWSWGYDTIVQGENGLTHPAGDPACAPVRTTLSSLPQVAAIANLCENTVTVGDRSVNAMGIRRIRGTIRPTILRGHALRARDDVVLGEKTLARLGKSIGDHVMVRSGRLHVDALIVGSTLFPTPNSHDTVTLADGALMRADTLARLGAGTFPQIVIRWRPGTDLHRALAQVRSRSGAPGIGPVRPPEVDRLLQLDNLPAILAGFLALLALTGVAHAVVTNASRRRRDLALLQTLGFRIRQIAGTIAAHALTIGVIGLAIGIPLGIVVGRLAWSAIAHGVGIADDADLPLLLLATTVPLALVAVLVIAYVPSRTASRIRPAVALRSE